MKANTSSKVLQWVGPVVLGTAAAVLTTALMGSAKEPVDPPAIGKLSAVVQQAPAAAAVETTSGVKMRDLEKRLAELEAAKEEQPEPEPTSDSSFAEGPPMMAPEEIARALQQQQDMQLAKHASEPLDPSWSPRATSSFQEDLGGLSPKGAFKVMDVECKTTSCVASVEWPSYDDAQRENGTITTAPYKVNCARSIYLPEPEDRGAPYRAKVVFDCFEARANKTASLP